MKLPTACFLLSKEKEWLPTSLQPGDVLIRDHMYRFGIRRDGQIIHANVDANPHQTYAPLKATSFETFQSVCRLIGYASGLNPCCARDDANSIFTCTLEGAAGENKGLFQNGDVFEFCGPQKRLEAHRDGREIPVANGCVTLPMDILGIHLKSVCTLAGNASRLAVCNSSVGIISRCMLVTPNDLADVA